MLANIIRNRKKTGIGGGGGGIVIDGGDPYYAAVSLMLSMDGTNGSTTFTDSSLNALTVTAVGNTQISTTQSKYGGASAYFDGSGDYLALGTQSQLDFGTGDFTIECWFQLTSTTNADQGILNDTRATFGTGSVLFKARQASGAGKICFQAFDFSSVGGRIVQSTTIPAVNTWYHVALVRSSGTVRLFVNGALESSGTWAGSVNFNYNNGTRIGHSILDGANGHLSGYIDDLRISRFARYVSNFTPPTAALPTTASSTVADPYYNYTSLLLHMDGTNTSTSFVDSGPNALAVTAAGNAQISTAQSKYGGASGYFDGSTGYLSLTGNSSFQFGTGDFTIEAWVYISANVANQQTFLDTRGAATATPFTFGLYQSKLAFYDGTMRQSSATVTTGQWYHFAACRSGGTLRLFIDGISYYSASSTTNFTTGANSIYIGRGFDAAAYYTNGLIDDLRITKYARYTSAFAPPAAALPEFATGNDRYFSNVSLLLHMDGANGSTIFTDNSANALAVTPVGNAQISTTQSQFGGASAYFDGTGDYLTVASHASIAFGLGDFTIECWVNFSALPTTNTIMGIANTMTSTTSAGFTHWWFGLEDSAGTKRLRLGRHGNASVFAYTNWTPSLNTWYFLQATRSSGSTIKLGVNGVLQAVTSSGSNWVNDFSSTGTLVVGYMATVLAFNGNIDDFRTTKGIAREIALPTSAFPNA
jgi:hypothetical protein